MKTKNDILSLIKEEIPYIKKRYYVKNIGLFGSFSRGEQTKASDIDMLVEFEKPVGFFLFIELEEYLSQKLRIKVDLVTPDALKPLIKPEIIKEVVYA